MLIAQISDLHIGAEPDDADGYNCRRLRRVLGAIADLPTRPDLLLVTGDIVDRGDPASYRRTEELLSACPIPWHAIPGNHDDRTSFSRAFPDLPTPGGFVQYVVDAGPIRLLLLDTLEEGRAGGGFCEQRAAWLDARLGEAPDTPAVLVLHHPPADLGIDWMREGPRPWIARLGETIDRHPQVAAILCGHLHRPVATSWRRIPIAACPSVAPGLAPDFRALDPTAPDGRALVVADTPGYALHWWSGSALVTHFASACDAAPLRRFDDAARPFLAGMMAEQA